MGTICASSYASIFMLEFEEKYIYSLIKNKCVIYLRYIDHIFMVWIKSESELRHFMNKMEIWSLGDALVHDVFLGKYLFSKSLC